LVDYTYIGNELEVFSTASNWKKYVKKHLSDSIGRNVLEAGSGPGFNTELLCGNDRDHWVCLEPDSQYVADVSNKVLSGQLPGFIEAVHGTIDAVPSDRKFDSILYLDVLEHIEHDREELVKAVERLESGGKLILLMPAFSFLYSNFDKNIGHYRRYTRKSLKRIIPLEMNLVKCHYLDSCSIPVSLAARFFFRSGNPSQFQINLWDRFFVHLSQIIDPFVQYSFGKTLIGVWKKI